MIYETGVRFVQQGTEIPLASIAALVVCLWIAAEIDARLTDHIRTNCESSDGRILPMGILKAFRAWC